MPVSRGLQLNCTAPLGTRQMAMPRSLQSYLYHITSSPVQSLAPNTTQLEAKPKDVRADPQPQDRMTGLSSETLPTAKETVEQGVLKPLDRSYAQASDLHLLYQRGHHQCEASELSHSSRTWSCWVWEQRGELHLTVADLLLKLL